MHVRFKRPSPALVIACLALFVALGSAGYAANGGNFILGQSNSATAQTSLTSTSSASPTLNLVNTAGRPAARFQANAGTAVFTVSNSTKIPNLNADRLDSLDSSAFVRRSQLAAVSGTGSCASDDGFVTACVAKAINLAKPGKLLLVATGSWRTFALDDTIGANAGSDSPTRVFGSCNLVVDGNAVGIPQQMGENAPDGTPTHPIATEGTMALAGLSGNLTAGVHMVEVDCQEQDGDIDWSTNFTAALVDDDSAPSSAVGRGLRIAGVPDQVGAGK